jgi:hypothetical protein
MSTSTLTWESSPMYLLVCSSKIKIIKKKGTFAFAFPFPLSMILCYSSVRVSREGLLEGVKVWRILLIPASKPFYNN